MHRRKTEMVYRPTRESKNRTLYLCPASAMVTDFQNSFTSDASVIVYGIYHQRSHLTLNTLLHYLENAQN